MIPPETMLQKFFFFLISQTYLSLTYGFMFSLNLPPAQDTEELVKKKSLSVKKKL